MPAGHGPIVEVEKKPDPGGTQAEPEESQTQKRIDPDLIRVYAGYRSLNERTVPVASAMNDLQSMAEDGAGMSW